MRVGSVHRWLAGGLVLAGLACNAILGNENGHWESASEPGGSSGLATDAASGGVASDAASSTSSSSGTVSSSSGAGPVDPCADAGAAPCKLPVTATLVAATEDGLFLFTEENSRFRFVPFDARPPSDLPLVPSSVVSVMDDDATLDSVIATDDRQAHRCNETTCTPLQPEFDELSGVISANQVALGIGKSTDGSRLYAFPSSGGSGGIRGPLLDPAPMTANTQRAFVAAGPSLIYAIDDLSVSLGSPFVVTAGAGSEPGARETIASTEQQVFVASDCPAGALICAIDATRAPDGNAPQTVTIYTGEPNAHVTTLYADRSTLFWSTDVPAVQTWRCDPSHCQSSATAIADGPAHSFTRNATHVFFVVVDAVYRVARTPPLGN